MKQKLFVLIAVFAVLAIGVFLSCDKDCPVCPEDNTGEPGNYRLYVLDTYNRFILSIDTPADTIVDSTRIDYLAVDLFVTPDGDRLLVRGDKFHIYNTSDLSFIETRDQQNCIYRFDGGDNYGIMSNLEKTYFINPSDLTPFDSIDFDLLPDESLNPFDAYLDTTSDQYFIVTSKLPDTTYIIFQIDCRSRSVVDSIKTLRSWGGGGPIAYNWLTNDLYFMTIFYNGSYFRQYDLTGDSLISSTYISHITGSISVSPDGRQVYMTDGGDGMHWIHPSRPIWVFDALTHQPIHWITPYDTSGKYVDGLFGQIILTPDNQRAYLGGNSNATGTPVTVIDLKLNRIIGVIEPFNVSDAASIALGPVPEN
ncbi:MAG TPA: hypothetical protein ENL22_04580 [candidate division Zixibacteria bacterium]|nr:hypothetical protein [candidate division Zixibacteria bacterium]